MKRILSTVAALALFTAPALAQMNGEMGAQLLWSAPLNGGTPSVRGVTPGASYSNVTTLSGGQGIATTAGIESGNGITPILMDDITFAPGTLPGGDISQLTFCVANFNTSTVSARARLRFWADDGQPDGANSPSTYYASGTPATQQGFTFNPITFNAGSVSCFFTTFAPTATGFKVPGSLKFWAGVQYDNNAGGTGASLAQLSNLGQAFFADVPDVGYSNPNEYWFGLSANNGFPNNVGTPQVQGFVDDFGYPAGGAPPVNFGWEFVSPAVPEPMTMGLLGLGAIALIRRRR